MADHEITLTIDGDRERLASEGRTRLIHMLQEELGVTAPKIGCETSKCVACTAELDETATVAADGVDTVSADAFVPEGELMYQPPFDYHHASNGYRVSVLSTYTERAVLAAVDDATDDSTADSLVGHRFTGRRGTHR